MSRSFRLCRRVSSNQLTALPACLGRAAVSLEVLDASHNLIAATHPEWGGRGAFPALKGLWLEHNRLQQLPPEWWDEGSFPSLQRLALSGNPLGAGTRTLAAAAAGSTAAAAAVGEDASARAMAAERPAGRPFGGALPQEWLLPQLRFLHLSGCGLRGRLPPGWLVQHAGEQQPGSSGQHSLFEM